MKKLLLIAVLAVAGVAAAVAQPRAIGLNLGTGNGISYQHSLGETNMLDVAVQVPVLTEGLGGIVTYDWINPFGTAIPWDYQGTWNWYLGVGGSAGVYGLLSTEYANHWYAGVVGHVGIEYQFWFPLQLSLDIRPTIGVDNTKDNKVGFGLAGLYNVSLGVRYLF